MFVAPPLLQFDSLATSYQLALEAHRLFASPPHEGFALLARVHGCAWLQAHFDVCYECTILCILAPRNTP
jgi:hypothetical protein